MKKSLPLARSLVTWTLNYLGSNNATLKGFTVYNQYNQAVLNTLIPKTNTKIMYVQEFIEQMGIVNYMYVVTDIR